MTACHKCQGMGKMAIKVSVPSQDDFKGVLADTTTINCIYCEGSGEETGKVFIEDLVEWCKCNTTDWSEFVHSREFGTDVYRHQKCGGVVQIG